MSSAETHSTIATVNEQFRRHLMNPDNPSCIPGKCVLTQGIARLSYTGKRDILRGIAEFNDFSPNHDPYGKHDFGRFDYKTHTIVWKIDYYDPSFKHGSEDPTDLTQTRRVLTVMLAHEC